MKQLTIKALSALLIFFFCSVIVLGYGCKGDDDDSNNTGPACNLTNADLSYTKNIKAIIDDKCLSCHAGSGPGPGNYTTFESLKPLLEDGSILDRVVVKKNMPQTSSDMSQAQRDSINCWIKEGYPK
jgi:uncharacterized membrane protein